MDSFSDTGRRPLVGRCSPSEPWASIELLTSVDSCPSARPSLRHGGLYPFPFVWYCMPDFLEPPCLSYGPSSKTGLATKGGPQATASARQPGSPRNSLPGCRAVTVSRHEPMPKAEASAGMTAAACLPAPSSRTGRAQPHVAATLGLRQAASGCTHTVQDERNPPSNIGS